MRSYGRMCGKITSIFIRIIKAQNSKSNKLTLGFGKRVNV